MDGVWFFIDKEYNQNFHWKLEKAKGYLYFAYRLIHQITYMFMYKADMLNIVRKQTPKREPSWYELAFTGRIGFTKIHG